MARRIRFAAVGAVVAASAISAQTAAAAPGWTLAQPAPPPGAQFKVPLGRPGDMKFYAANRGLLSVEGNSTIPRGLYAWDGQQWHELSTVCGGPGDTSRIAFAGPDEWWTVSEPSQPRVGSGTALCHFANGEVVASYSTPYQSSDPIQQMDAAACNGPNDCWFGGYDATSPSGDRRGAFHLHWDGTALHTVYAPFGHAVSGLWYQGGAFYETSLLGARPEDTGDPITPPDASSAPALIHEISGGQFQDDPFTPASQPNGSELLSVNGDGSQVWAVGGGAASGAGAPSGSSVARPPLAARSTGGPFTEVPIDSTMFGTNDRFADVAAVPGTPDAWAAVVPFDLRNSNTAKAEVVQLSPAGAVGTVTQLPSSGAGRGVAARVSFSAPNDGWLVTSAGWLFHYTDGSQPPLNTDPAWQGTITFRPNEAAEQFVPDTPPTDDSQLFAPPPVDIQPPVAPVSTTTKALPALLRHVKVKLHGLTLSVSFQLVRKARVGLVGRRGGAVVARVPTRTLRPGRYTLKLKLDRRRYPTRLQFLTREPGQASSGGGSGGSGSSGDTVTTGGGSGGGGGGSSSEPTGNGQSQSISRVVARASWRQ